LFVSQASQRQIATGPELTTSGSTLLQPSTQLSFGFPLKSLEQTIATINYYLSIPNVVLLCHGLANLNPLFSLLGRQYERYWMERK
jgi:hypothetical protein